MGMDWKVPRRWNREDEGPWRLCGSDGRRSVGETARRATSPKRAGGAASRLAHEFQGICYERLPSPETQEMEGLNRPDNNRTNWNTSDYGIRELRTGRSYPGSTAEVSRRQSTLALAERGKPSSMGFERDLQDGCGGLDRPRQSGRFARYAEGSENSGKTYDDQRTGPVGTVSLRSEGKDHFPACGFSGDAAWRNSRAEVGEG